MAKFKVSDKGNLITITHKQFKKFEINQRELDAFEEHLIPGFFRPKVIKPNRIDYVAPTAMPLDKYMGEGFSVHKLYSVLAQFIEITKRIDMYHLYLQNLVLDKSVIYVKQLTGELFFLYEPLTSNDNSANFYTFVIDLISGIKTENRELSGELSRVLHYLKNPEHYRVDDIENMINQFYPQIYQQIIRAEKGKSGFINSSHLSYERNNASITNATLAEQKINASFSGNISGSALSASLKENTYYPPSMNFEQTTAMEEGTTLLCEEEGTTLLSEDEGTTLLCQTGPSGRLTRLRTSEEVIVSGNYFLMGKGVDTDFPILNNTAISRHHASIRLIGNDFYLIDENSKNHTWVNGKLVTPGVEELLVDGAQIRMADEEFVFTVE